MSARDKIFYCKWCGNNLSDNRNNLCKECREKALKEKHKCHCGCGQIINKWNLSHCGNIRKVKYKNKHGRFKNKFIEIPKKLERVYHISSWMLDNLACPACGKVFVQRAGLFRHVCENKCEEKERIKEFKYWWDKRFRCMCGCGEKTNYCRKVINGHKENEPWNKGLTKNDDERLMEYSRRAFRQVQNDYRFKKNMSNTSIERKVKKFLKKLGIDYTQSYSFYYFYFADFAIPKQRKIIECDGDYWHGTEKAQKRDKEINKFIKKKGWRILRLKEHEINNNFKKIKKEIVAFL